MPLPGGKSFDQFVSEIKEKQGVSDATARKIAGSIEKRIKTSKLKLQLMSLQLDVLGKKDRTYTGVDIARPKKKKPKYANNHKIVWYNSKLGKVRTASLVEEDESGKFAKYWLLNAKDTNGNGWGVTQQSIAKNIQSFINKPFVITAKKWIPDSMYGDVYDHPHLPTNDMNRILSHQEHFRVGNIVDVHERDGQWFAVVARDPRFAHLNLPAFCSPAIYQLNPLERDASISKWTGLHLAGLDENPAYGAQIAILRGSCDGPKGQCIHQLKEAKLRTGIKLKKGELEETKRGIGRVMKAPNKTRFEQRLFDKFLGDDTDAAKQLGVIGRTRDDEKFSNEDLKDFDEGTMGALGTRDFEQDQADIDISKRLNPDKPHDVFDRLKRIRQGKFKLAGMQLAIIEGRRKADHAVSKVLPRLPNKRVFGVSEFERELEGTMETGDKRVRPTRVDDPERNNPSGTFLRSFSKKNANKGAALRSQSNTSVNRVNVLGTRKRKKPQEKVAVKIEENDFGVAQRQRQKAEGRIMMEVGEQRRKQQERHDKSKRKLARIEKGNTTFNPLTPEDIADVEDIDRNIKPLKGTKAKGEFTPATKRAFLEPTSTFSNSFKKKKHKIPKPRIAIMSDEAWKKFKDKENRIISEGMTDKELNDMDDIIRANTGKPERIEDTTPVKPPTTFSSDLKKKLAKLQRTAFQFREDKDKEKTRGTDERIRRMEKLSEDIPMERDDTGAIKNKSDEFRIDSEVRFIQQNKKIRPPKPTQKQLTKIIKAKLNLMKMAFKFKDDRDRGGFLGKVPKGMADRMMQMDKLEKDLPVSKESEFEFARSKSELDFIMKGKPIRPNKRSRSETLDFKGNRMNEPTNVVTFDRATKNKSARALDEDESDPLERARFDETFGDIQKDPLKEIPPVRVDTFSKFPETKQITKKDKRFNEPILVPMNKDVGSRFEEGSPLGQKVEERRINRKLLKDTGQEEGFMDMFKRKFGPGRNDKPSLVNRTFTMDKDTAKKLARMRYAVKLIKDEEIRNLRNRIGPGGNFPDDSMKRSPEDAQRNFAIQTRGIASDRLKALGKRTRRDNPNTPLVKEVPFGKENRPKKNVIGDSLKDEDESDAFRSLDFADENNPIVDPLSSSGGFSPNRLKKPRRSEFTRIIGAKQRHAIVRIPRKVKGIETRATRINFVSNFVNKSRDVVKGQNIVPESKALEKFLNKGQLINLKAPGANKLDTDIRSKSAVMTPEDRKDKLRKFKDTRQFIENAGEGDEDQRNDRRRQERDFIGTGRKIRPRGNSMDESRSLKRLHAKLQRLAGVNTPFEKNKINRELDKDTAGNKFEQDLFDSINEVSGGGNERKIAEAFKKRKRNKKTGTTTFSFRTGKLNTQLVRMAVILKNQAVIDAFRKGKPGKSRAFRTDGKAFKLFGHEIARKTKGGLEVSNAGFPTSKTYDTLRSLGVNVRTQKGVTKINNKVVDPTSKRFHMIPNKDISKEKIFFSTPQQREQLKIRNKERGTNPLISEQRKFREQSREKVTGSRKGIPLSPTQIQPHDQRMINKITGVKSPIGRSVKGTEQHHILFKEKNPGLAGNVNNAIPQTPIEHDLLHKLNAKLMKMAGFRKFAPRDTSTEARFDRADTIDKFLETPKQTKRFLSESQRNSPPGNKHRQMPEGKANEQFTEKGIKINPSKFKGKRIDTNIKRKLAKKAVPNLKDQSSIIKHILKRKKEGMDKEGIFTDLMDNEHVDGVMARHSVESVRFGKRIYCLPCARSRLNQMQAQLGIKKPMSGAEIVKRFMKVQNKLPKNKGFTFNPETGNVFDATDPKQALGLRKELGVPNDQDVFFDANTRGITKPNDLIPNLDRIKGQRLVGGFIDKAGKFELDATTTAFGGTKDQDRIRLKKEKQIGGIRVSPKGQSEFFDT